MQAGIIQSAAAQTGSVAALPGHLPQIRSVPGAGRTAAFGETLLLDGRGTGTHPADRLPDGLPPGAITPSQAGRRAGTAKGSIPAESRSSATPTPAGTDHPGQTTGPGEAACGCETSLEAPANLLFPLSAPSTDGDEMNLFRTAGSDRTETGAAAMPRSAPAADGKIAPATAAPSGTCTQTSTQRTEPAEENRVRSTNLHDHPSVGEATGGKGRKESCHRVASERGSFAPVRIASETAVVGSSDHPTGATGSGFAANGAADVPSPSSATPPPLLSAPDGRNGPTALPTGVTAGNDLGGRKAHLLAASSPIPAARGTGNDFDGNDAAAGWQLPTTASSEGHKSNPEDVNRAAHGWSDEDPHPGPGPAPALGAEGASAGPGKGVAAHVPENKVPSSAHVSLWSQPNPVQADAPAPQGSPAVTHPLFAHAPLSQSVAHSSSGSEPAAGTAFEKIETTATARVLQSTPQRLSVGVRDAELGWVEVRAHAAAGQIAAAVLTGSGTAHALLAAQLPAMRDSLAEQQVRLDRLELQSFPSSSGGHGGGSPPGNAGDSQSTAGNAEGTLQSVPAAALSEGETESMSYISIRV